MTLAKENGNTHVNGQVSNTTLSRRREKTTLQKTNENFFQFK